MGSREKEDEGGEKKKGRRTEEESEKAEKKMKRKKKKKKKGKNFHTGEGEQEESCSLGVHPDAQWTRSVGLGALSTTCFHHWQGPLRKDDSTRGPGPQLS